jgi:hypothetical protein
VAPGTLPNRFPCAVLKEPLLLVIAFTKALAEPQCLALSWFPAGPFPSDSVTFCGWQRIDHISGFRQSPQSRHNYATRIGNTEAMSVPNFPVPPILQKIEERCSCASHWNRSRIGPDPRACRRRTETVRREVERNRDREHAYDLVMAGYGKCTREDFFNQLAILSVPYFLNAFRI